MSQFFPLLRPRSFLRILALAGFCALLAGCAGYDYRVGVSYGTGGYGTGGYWGYGYPYYFGYDYPYWNTKPYYGWGYRYQPYYRSYPYYWGYRPHFYGYRPYFPHMYPRPYYRWR